MAKRIKRLRAKIAAALAERDEAREALASARAEVMRERHAPSIARALAEREMARQVLPPRPVTLTTLDLARLRRDVEVRRVELHNASARYGAIINQRGYRQERTAAGVAAAALIDERARIFVAAEHELAAADAVAGRAIGGQHAERGHS